MANHNIINREFELPEAIIQHIQSFMCESDAAATIFLSKSWYSAWATRPNLSFNQSQFPNGGFPQFARETMQRYEDLNLMIHTFRLRMEEQPEFESRMHFYIAFAKDLVVRAIKLGVVDLTIDASFFNLPDEVLQSKTLARLSVNGYSSITLDLQKMREKEVITLSNLKSLSLNRVIVEGGDLFRDLISRFPLIEELKLNQPRFEERSPYYDSGIKLDEFDNLEFPKLRYLDLRHLNAKNILCRRELWAKFPCLKELVISNHKFDCKDVRICSRSLERIAICLPLDRVLNAEFDVPNIRKFEFEGCPFSRLDFKTTTCKEWESDIRLHCLFPSYLWFASLNVLAKMLKASRVSLTINVCYPVEENYDRYGFVGDGLPLPKVETLKLKGYAANSALRDALFRSICPNLVKVENPKFAADDEDFEVAIESLVLFGNIGDDDDWSLFGYN